MAEPVYESFASAEAQNPTSLEVAAPSGSVEGELWLAFVYNTDGGTVTASIADWDEEITDVGGGSGLPRLTVFSRYVPASPGSTTINFSSAPSSGIAVIARVSGAHAIAAINAIAALSDVDTGVFTTQTAPSVTTTVDECLIFRVVGVLGETITASPETSRWSLIGTGGIIGSNYGSTHDAASAGATGTATWTTSNNQRWAAVTVAIAPAAAPPAAGPFIGGTFVNQAVNRASTF